MSALAHWGFCGLTTIAAAALHWAFESCRGKQQVAFPRCFWLQVCLLFAR